MPQMAQSPPCDIRRASYSSTVTLYFFRLAFLYRYSILSGLAKAHSLLDDMPVSNVKSDQFIPVVLVVCLRQSHTPTSQTVALPSLW